MFELTFGLIGSRTGADKTLKSILKGMKKKWSTLSNCCLHNITTDAASEDKLSSKGSGEET